MNLKDLLYKVKILRLFGTTDIVISDIQFDSQKICKGSLFVAIKGMLTDGHQYIEDAIQNGVSAVIVEQIPDEIDANITYIQVENSYNSLAVVASNFYHNPSTKLKLVGVTGTNGKTTIVSLLHQLFTLLNKKAGMISTIENKVVDKVFSSTHTTPDPLQINYLLDQMVSQDCEYCFIEVSSHALVQNRVNSLYFSAGIFTNITREHLDYHKTFSEYRDVKKSFFDSLNEDAFALINKDDKNYKKMIESTKSRKVFYALRSLADYRCKVLENQFEGMLLQINKIDVWVKLIGDFNAYNILSSYALAKEFGFEDHEVLTALSMLDSAEGRFQFVRNNNAITGIVDYAHTDDALKNILSTINDIRNSSNSLITIIGCGGDRDKSKRLLMAQVACNLSTKVIITSDNPRSENPKDIIQDMTSGLDPIQKKKVLVITDRREAIMTAGKLVKEYDIILLAGKGHEKYQEIKGKKFPFNDMKELKESLNIN
ncbi:MAG: UDP-N-acetylmuramoyl-L-alanyl-D-glutamate--2,6-diaminopimelate ligase [Flavobacteriales bacterium]|nr:UDP-N-acetylmuramoyl-L-alanyl-D-glutamate--2,6-diaminopimelate ligase [Flavobacteriales bacterium]